MARARSDGLDGSHTADELIRMLREQVRKRNARTTKQRQRLDQLAQQKAQLMTEYKAVTGACKNARHRSK